MGTPTEYRDYTRIDKNIAFNILDFRKVSDDYTNVIIKNLLIYFSKSYQSSDLFGYQELDPHKFAEEMQIQVKELFRRSPNPRQILDMKGKTALYDIKDNKNAKIDLRKRLWSSRLEDALYILNTTTIFSSFQFTNDEYDIERRKSFIVLDEIGFISQKRLGSNKARNADRKIMYSYKLNETFERNLRKFFLPVKLDTFLELKTRKLDDAYLQFLNVYHTYKLKNNSYKWSFDQIRVLTGVSNNGKTTTARKVKYRINKKLDIVAERIGKQIPGLKLKWIAGDDMRYPYSLEMYWTQVSKEYLKEVNKTVLDDIFKQQLRRFLFEVYLNNEKGSAVDLKGFYNWMRNDETKKEFITAYSAVWLLNRKSSNAKSNTSTATATMASSFYNMIKEAQTFREIDLLFKGGTTDKPIISSVKHGVRSNKTKD